MDGGRNSVSCANAAETSLTSRNGSRLSEAKHACLIVSVFSSANCRYSISLYDHAAAKPFFVISETNTGRDGVRA
jgi:hypothetical protein